MQLMNRITIAGSAVFCAGLAHASGDPMVVYYAAAGGVVQVGILGFLFATKKFRGVRIQAFVAYALNIIPLWGWVWNSSQSPHLLGGALVVMPVLSLAILLWFSRSHNKSK